MLSFPHLPPFKPSKVRPFLALLILAALISILLFANYSSLKGLQQAAVNKTQNEINQWAQATEYYFNERYNDIRDLAGNSLVTAFFKNRSLGMSMHYGLQASLNNVSRTFRHYRNTKQLNKRLIYTRIYLVDPEGNILTSASRLSTSVIQPVPEKNELQPGQVMVKSHSSGAISFTCPVYVHDVLHGYVVGWISYDALYQYLLGQRSELFFVVADKRVVFQSKYSYSILFHSLEKWQNHTSPLQLSLQGFTESYSYGKGGGEKFFLFYADLTKYPVRLYLAAPVKTITHQTEFTFFTIGLIMLSVTVFLFAALIIRTNTKNLLLSTSLEAAVERTRIINAQKNELLEAKEAAESSNRAKSIFLSNMSHELRTPLNAILGYCQIFSGDSTLTPQQQNGVNTMHQAGEHLLLLINDILDLSKIESGKMVLITTKFRLSEFLQGIADIIRIKAEEKGLTFTTDFDQNLPAGIAADALRLRQVLLNLLSNAVKFTSKGYCSLHVHARPGGKQSLRLFFSVEDSGPGIAVEQQEKVFEPFWQGGDHLKHIEGTGLGLAISQKIVRLMGGNILLQSPVNGHGGNSAKGGCRFSFTIEVPVVSAVRGRENGFASTIIGYRAPDGMQKNILLVDDNVSNRKVLRDTLEPLDFLTCEAADGSEVATVCARFRPDAILMDLRMPVVDGFTATKDLQADPDFSHIPVIALTASAGAESELRKDYRNHGFSGYINKPYSIRELLQVLARQLNLELVYQPETVTSSGKMQDIELPAAENLEALLQLIRVGDIDGVLTEITRLSAMEGGRYRPFTEKIQPLANDLKLMAIEQFIVACTGE